jgi:hypothetical protein
MFRTVFSSIITSSRLHMQEQTYVKQILLPATGGTGSHLQQVAETDSSSWLYYRNTLKNIVRFNLIRSVLDDKRLIYTNLTICVMCLSTN